MAAHQEVDQADDLVENEQAMAVCLGSQRQKKALRRSSRCLDFHDDMLKDGLPRTCNRVPETDFLLNQDQGCPWEHCQTQVSSIGKLDQNVSDYVDEAL